MIAEEAIEAASKDWLCDRLSTVAADAFILTKVAEARRMALAEAYQREPSDELRLECERLAALFVKYAPRVRRANRLLSRRVAQLIDRGDIPDPNDSY